MLAWDVANESDLTTWDLGGGGHIKFVANDTPDHGGLTIDAFIPCTEATTILPTPRERRARLRLTSDSGMWTASGMGLTYTEFVSDDSRHRMRHRAGAHHC